MPIMIQPYRRQVTNVGTRGVQVAGAQAAPLMVTGGQIALQAGVKAADQIVRTLAERENERKENQLATMIMNDTSQLQKSTMDFEADYRKNNQGEKALNAAQSYEEFQKAQRQQYLDKYKDNPKAQLAMAARLDQVGGASLSRGYAYADQQEQVFKKDTADAMFSTLQQSAVGKDWGAVQGMVEQHMADMQVLFPGRNLTAMRADVEAGLLSNNINAMLAERNIGGARALYTQNKALLGSNADEMLARIKSEERSAAAEARAAAEKSSRAQMLGDLDSMFGAYGLDLAQGYQHIREKYKNDPSKRLAMESAWSSRVSLESAAAKQTRNLQVQAEVKEGVQQIFTQDITPAAASALVAQATPEAQPTLEAAVRKRFATPEVFASDAGKLMEANKDIAEGTFNANPEAFKLKYQPYLSDKDMEAKVSVLRKQQDSAIDRGMRAAFNAELRKWKLDDMAGDANMTKTEFARVAYETFTTDLVDMGIFDPQGKRKYMQEFFKKTALRTSRWWWADKDENVPAFQAREKIADGAEIVVPTDFRLRAIEALTARNIPATEENIKRVYLENNKAVQ